jgi:hypothetical protein
MDKDKRDRRMGSRNTTVERKKDKKGKGAGFRDTLL